MPERAASDAEGESEWGKTDHNTTVSALSKMLPTTVHSLRSRFGLLDRIFLEKSECSKIEEDVPSGSSILSPFSRTVVGTGADLADVEGGMCKGVSNPAIFR